MRGTNRQLGAAGAELSAAFGQLAHRIDRRLPASRARANLDVELGLRVEPLPQRRVITGEFELRRAVQLQHQRIRLGRSYC